MKITLVGINAKYAHTNLAIRMLKKYAGSSQVGYMEYTINMDASSTVQALLQAGSDAYGISLYIWNAAYGVFLGDKLKAAGKIVFYGGPEAAARRQELVRRCDFVFTGEGEIPFRQWVKAYIEGRDWRRTPGIAYLENGRMAENPGIEADMDDLPQAYDDLDKLKNRLVYYEASRGCPFRCSYCLSGGKPGVRYRSIEKVIADLDDYIHSGVMKVKFVDRTFNSDKKWAAQIIRHIVSRNPETDFHFEMAPDLVDEEIIAAFHGARKGLFRIEMGIQSANPNTLDAIQRRQDLDKTRWAVAALKQYATIHLDLIAGLPLEDYNSFRRSFNLVMDMRPHVLQLGFLKVLKGSLMEQDAARYGIKYRKEPPYEVVSTAHMSEKELSALKRVEYALERVYHSGLFLNSFEYFSQGDPFQFLDRLSQFSPLHLCSEEDLAETITNYGISQGFALAGDMVKLDRLLKKNRPKVKFSPDGKEERRRELYKKLTLKNLPKGKRPWHYARIEWFGFDVLAYLERKEIVLGESVFLFDYTGSKPVITKLID